MLEKLPAGVGQVLQDVRAGLDEITAHDARFIDVTASFEVHSTDFVDEGSLPVECTADGAGRSPALAWGRLPGRSRALALIVEDADSPTPHPLVHAIAWNLPVEQGSLSRGALHDPDDGPTVQQGRNSYLKQAWLPPDPPPGHGPHRYVFQFFALDEVLGLDSPGRKALVEAMQGHVLATALLVGMYERR